MALLALSARPKPPAFRRTRLPKPLPVVLSELEGGNNDNASFLYDTTRAAAFQYHPYHYPVIGTKWDVVHFTREQVYDYYRRHYAPNDATLVVVGDFATDRMLARIRE